MREEWKRRRSKRRERERKGCEREREREEMRIIALCMRDAILAIKDYRVHQRHSA
jgi:hypothetical protein